MKETELSKCLQTHPEILFAYLFGSQATGKARKNSDIDIAIYLEKKNPPNRTFDWRLRMMGELGAALRSNTVEVIVLNEAPLILRYEVISKGKLLLSANPSSELDFRLKTMSEYFDTAPFRSMLRHIMRQKIEEGTFFGQSRSA